MSLPTPESTQIDSNNLFVKDAETFAAAQARHKALVSGSVEPTLHESELLLTEFIQSAPFKKRFGADHKFKGLTHGHWLLLPKFVVMWLNHAERKPLARQIHAWSIRKLRTFLLALRAGKWTPPIPPPEVKLNAKRWAPSFPAGVLSEDAPPSRTKTEALNKRNLKRAADDQELPEEPPRHRQKGAPVTIQITQAWVLPQFMTTDSMGQTVSNRIVAFDPRQDTIDHLATILAEYDINSHKQAVAHNALVIVFAARWDLYLHGCTKPIQDSYILQARAQVGKFYPVLYDQLQGMLWSYDGGRREVLNELATKYSARLAAFEEEEELNSDDEHWDEN